LGNLSGWNGGVAAGLTKHLSVTADFSGYYKNFNTTFDGSNFDASLRAYTFLFGPQIQKNGEQLRPFARALFGIAHGSAKLTVDGDSGKVQGPSSRHPLAADWMRLPNVWRFTPPTRLLPIPHI
jgi:hypothetical protein